MTLGSIRVRIVAAFLAALLALLGAQGFQIWQQQRLSRSLALITGGYLPLAKIVARLDHDRQRVDNDVQRLLRDEPRPATGPASSTLVYTEALQQNLAEGRIHVRYARGLAGNAEEQAVLNQIDGQLAILDRLFQEYQARSSAFVVVAEAGQRDELRDLAAPLIRVGSQLGEEINKFALLIDGRVDELTRATEQAQLRATAVSSGMGVLAFAFSFALVAAVLYAMRPIGRLTTEVQRLAAGDYGGRVEVRGTDEVAILATEFNAMSLALQARDRALVERAEQLNRLSRYLKSVVDSLDDGLLVIEEDRVTLANPSAHRVWGATQGGPPPGALGGLLAPDPSARREIEGPGRTLHEVRAIPFGESGVVVVSADVTEQTRTRERLARSERLALVGQMLAQITHEVRNPLNALSLNAELLADELAALDPDRHTEAWELLATVASEIERLTQVTAHYLQLARRPKAMLELEDLRSLLDDVIRLLDAELQQAEVRLTLRAEPLPPQRVDGNQMKQATLNVIRNAVEAGARSLSLELTCAEGEIRLALHDDGAGMSAEEVDKACEPFFSTKATGTGLGLAITRQILEDHDGVVRVSSTPGRGTSVVLAFPERPSPTSET
jgi:signal transduction histidine kinase/HAMP domain-containing protein